MKLPTWVIEPRDTLVVRDGRPSRQDTPMGCLPFPLPSSVAGLVRSEIGFDHERVFRGDPNALKQVEVAGPWLVEQLADGAEVFAPAPADARWLAPPAPRRATSRARAGVQPEVLRVRCAVGQWPAGVSSDLPDGLMPVLPVDGKGLAGKPPKETPGFWRWGGDRGLGNWLFAPPSAREVFDRDTLNKELGPEKLEQEERTHVALDAGRTAVDGALFSTAGLRLTDRRRRFAVGFACDSDAFAAKAGKRPVFLGGERRLSSLMPCPSAWPEPSDSQWDTLSGALQLRVMLLTPGLFEQGFRPSDHQIKATFGIGAKLIGAAVDRPTIVSGFNFERNPKNNNRPYGAKPVRRAAPAGSVYWIELDAPLELDVLKKAWMSSLCDERQDRLDGFGRILLGVGR